MARGSIKKHVGKRGTSWYAVVDLPPDPATGKRRQKRISAPTKRECEALVAQLLHAVEGGEVADAGKVTVREFADRWLASAEPSLRPSTFRRYADLLRLHVLPVVGNVRLARLGPADVQRLHADRLGAGLSRTTVASAHYLLHRVLEDAVRWGLLARNVTEAVDAPRRSTPEAGTWDAAQVARVLAVADRDEDGCGALWRLALLTGMRRGELLGLQWPDVDLGRGTVAVRRTLSRGKGGSWVVGSPKTALGKRTIALPASCVAALRAHRVAEVERRLALGPAWQDGEWVFTGAAGGPLHPNSLVLRFRKLVAASGVPAIRFHDLRHTSATLMLANGTNPRVVQERLGHANIGITLGTYSHVTAELQREAADRLDALVDAAAGAVS